MALYKSIYLLTYLVYRNANTRFAVSEHSLVTVTDVVQPLDEVFSRNLAVAVKNSEMTPDDNEKPTDITQSQDVTSDVQCLQQVCEQPERLSLYHRLLFLLSSSSVMITFRQVHHSSYTASLSTSTWPHLRCDVGLQEEEY